MTTRYDPWVNMLRGTIAAFAAGVGGAAAVTVWPFDAGLGVPDEFGRRIARNVSALLLEESHVGAVADPAGGAYAVEKLTAELALAAWRLFGDLEAAGGATAVLADGTLRARFDTTARARAGARGHPALAGHRRQRVPRRRRDPAGPPAVAGR